jgi:PGF-CTERM protein
MFALVAVLPVSATFNGNYYEVARNINQGATVFIGEEGLNVMNAFWNAGAQDVTKIGWWASAANVQNTPYSQSYDFGQNGRTSFTVGDTFVGYTGNWYALNNAGQAIAPVFNVQDPTLSVNLWDFSQNADVTGKSIPQGEVLGFKISTNMISALSGQRSPVFGVDGSTTKNSSGMYPEGDGYINVRVKDESGATFTSVNNGNGGTLNLNSLAIRQTPTTIGSLANGWDTDSLNTNGQLAYPIGTYTVWAESRLNNMKENYKNGGVDYTTKTVSQTVTASVVSSTVKIEANKDTVIRSKPFSVTVTGKPRTTYKMWLKGTSNLAGGMDGQPPMVNTGQEGVVFDTNAGSVEAQRALAIATTGSALGYAYQNAGAGRVVFDDVAHSADVGYGTRTAVNVVTSASGTRTVEWITTNYTKAQKYTVRVELQEASGSFKSDEVDVKVEKGAVTIVAAGDQSYFLGEEIRFSGTNTESYKTYLFIIGPNLADAGAMLDAPREPVINQDASTFVVADVAGDNTWSYKWGTATIPLDAGTYTVYGVSQPVDRNHLGDASYGTVSIIIKKPFVSATASQSTVAKGDRIYITGTAEGNPSPGVAIWILGKNYAFYQTESVNSDSSFKYEVKQEDTKTLTSGQYFVVVQHPMANNQFDIDLDPSRSGRLMGAETVWVKNEILNDLNTDQSGTRLFVINGAGALQGSDAAEALVQAINDPNVDDTYTKLQFLIEEGTITIVPIGDKYVGDKFTIRAATNLAVDDEILMQVYSSSFKPTQKSQSGEFSGATGTVKVVKGETGLNSISFDVDASTFKPDEYIVTAEAVIQGTTGTALFNVLEGVPPTPTPTQSPGYGALIALIGLGAVAFIVVRRH